MDNFLSKLFLLSLFFAVVCLQEGHHTNGGPTKSDNRSCADPVINLRMVDEKYDAKRWPYHQNIEKCVRQHRPDLSTTDIVPHPCAYRIEVGLKFTDLKDIDVAENLVLMNIVYLEEWVDPRIVLPSLMNPMCRSADTVRPMMYLEPVKFYRDRLWTPDFYIRGSLRTRMSKLIKTSEALILHQNNKIENVVTLNMVIMCPMDFQNYPFDTQICNFTIESYGTFHSRIAIVWLSSGIEILPAFRLEGYEVSTTQQEPSKVTYGGYSYPRLQATLSFRRLWTKHILLIYVPSMLHFGIAWLAFFLPKEVSQGRCIINCSTTLSLVSMLSVYTRNSPHGGYVKALDIWCYFSIFFQFVCTLDAMIDTRLLYMASNIKRNPVEGGTRRVWGLFTDTSNWLGKEVRLVRSRDEGRGFDDTVRDLRRMTHHSGPQQTQTPAAGQQPRKVSTAAARSQVLRKYLFSPRYYRFLKMVVVYQEWSQYICLAWYLVFLLGYWVLYVP